MGSTGTVLRELRGAQKSAKGVSLYSRYVNRPACRVLAAMAYRTGLTPNQVTLVSALFTYSALVAVALVEPSWTLAVLVYAALAIGFAFDSADGQLARLTGRAGPTGSGWTMSWTAESCCSSTPRS
ncbi:CDP-alcohol phosphatidyltransferase [Streptomyces badius]